MWRQPRLQSIQGIRDDQGHESESGDAVRRGIEAFSLDGKRAVVTGGNRGLGLAFVQALAECGASVALLARDKAETTQLEPSWPPAAWTSMR